MKNYKFEWNDLRCLITIINVVLIMIYGLSIAWFGLAVGVFGVIKDLCDIKKDNFRWNGVIMHGANIALNIYFIIMLYVGQAYDIIISKEKIMFYIIVTSNERSCSHKYIATTLEECEKHIMEFANFYCPNGCVHIDVVDNYFRTIEFRTYWKGELQKVDKH